MKLLSIFLCSILTILSVGATWQKCCAQTYDATGTWNYSTTNNWNNCGEPPDPDVTNTMTITQTGNSVTAVDNLTGRTYTGTVSGANYSVSATFPEDGGTTSDTINFALSSNTSGSGTASWSWSGSGFSCSGGRQQNLTKVGVGANPSPNIKANGSDGPVTTTNNLSVTVALNPGSGSGNNADWWVVIETSFGWYHYDVGSGSWASGLAVTYQGPLFDLPQIEVLNMGLPVGTYTFYFGVDTNMNGSLDSGSLFFDSVVVNISVAVSPCTNIAGNWFGTETVTMTCCLGGDCETQTFSGTDSVTIQQSGCNISYDITIKEYGTFSRTGTIDGDNIQLSGIFAVLQPWCSATQNVVTANGTIISGEINLNGSGIVEGICNGMNFSCTGTSTAVLTRPGYSSVLETMDEEESISGPSSQLLHNYLEIFTIIAH